MEGNCPIWGGNYSAQIERSVQDGLTFVIASPRAGGSFTIEDTVRVGLSLDDQEKARLTTWILDQNTKGAWLPEITREIVDYARGVPPLPAYERANRLLHWLAGETTCIGETVPVTQKHDSVFAWSESAIPAEVGYLLDYLKDQRWIYLEVNGFQFGNAVYPMLTVEGHRQIEALEVNPLSSQAFVAMWFDESVKEIRQYGIMSGIEDAGYKPYVVDEDEHIGKIDDKIIAEIRRSRFIVADFTHGEKGARGGVYFEAGFGLGLGIPVIYTCHKGQMSDVHFDTQHYNHILWEKPEELREALANRIRAVLGQGPEPLPSP